MKAAADMTYCIGFVAGIGATMSLTGSWLMTEPELKARDPGISICYTGILSPGAMIQAFRNWAEKHPESWGARDALGVMHALNETWPCK